MSIRKSMSVQMMSAHGPSAARWRLACLLLAGSWLVQAAAHAGDDALPPGVGPLLEECTGKLQAVRRGREEDAKQDSAVRLAAYERYLRALTALQDAAIRRNQLEEANELADTLAWAEYQADELDGGTRQRSRRTRELDGAIADADARLGKAMDAGDLATANRLTGELKVLKEKRQAAEKAAMPVPTAGKPTTAKSAQKNLETDLQAADARLGRQGEARDRVCKDALAALLAALEKTADGGWGLRVAAELDRLDGGGREIGLRAAPLQKEMARKEEEKRAAMKARDLSRANAVQQEIEALSARIRNVKDERSAEPAGLGSKAGVAWVEAVGGARGAGVAAAVKPGGAKESEVKAGAAPDMKGTKCEVASGATIRFRVELGAGGEFLNPGEWYWNSNRTTNGWKQDGDELVIRPGGGGMKAFRWNADAKKWINKADATESLTVVWAPAKAEGKMEENLDAAIRKVIVGVWTVKYDDPALGGAQVWTFRADGSWDMAPHVNVAGSWRVEAGEIHGMINGMPLVIVPEKGECRQGQLTWGDVPHSFKMTK